MFTRTLTALSLTLLSLTLLSQTSLSQTSMSQTSPSQTSLQDGRVINASTNEPIAGASIRVEGTNRGTYTRSGGVFRLPLPENATYLNVRSIGYEEQRVRVTPGSTLTIKLVQSSVTKSNVNVVGDITPEEVIKRASQRADENSKRIKTLVSTTYSKMRVSVDAMMVQEVDDNESISETFSKIYMQRVPERKKRIHILQRRQTKNILPEQNLAVFDEFFDFTTPEITIIQTRLVTPLSPDALDDYQYVITGKRPLGDKMVYELAFEPKARMYPGFEGTLSIIEGTYQVIAADFAPTEETSFPFIKGLRYQQRYERIDDSLWVPMYQQATAAAGVDVIAGVIGIKAKVNMETFVTDVEANVAIADSLLNPPEKDSAKRGRVRADVAGAGVSVRMRGNVVTVDDEADSTKPEFWDEHAFAELSDEEREAYRVADSLAQAAPPKKNTGDERQGVGVFSIGPVGFNIVPVIDRSSITGMMYGAELSATYDPATLTFGGAFGQEGTQTGFVGLDVDLVRTRDFDLSVRGSVYSKLATVQATRSILKRFDFLNASNILYTDYSDFYRRDGFDVGIQADLGVVSVAVEGASSRHITMPLIETVERDVVLAQPGDYRTLEVSASIAEPSFIDDIFGSGSPVFGSISALYGEEAGAGLAFGRAEVSIGTRIATIATGYYPMRLDLDLFGGVSLTDSLPRQYQFAMLRRFNILGTRTDMLSVPINGFGGTQYVRAHVEHNFTDLWWRALGLPTLGNNRGVDLIGVFGAAKVWQENAPFTPGRTYDATNDVYMEAGFAVGRIPTFVSDLIFLRFDARWPVGVLAPRGSFGWALSLSSPLL